MWHAWNKIFLNYVSGKHAPIRAKRGMWWVNALKSPWITPRLNNACMQKKRYFQN